MPSVRVLNQRRNHRHLESDVPGIDWKTSVNGNRFTQVAGQPVIIATVFDYGDLESAVLDVSVELSRLSRGTGILFAEIDPDAILPRQFSAANLAAKHVSVRLVDDPVDAANRLYQDMIAHAAAAQANFAAFAERVTKHRKSNPRKRHTSELRGRLAEA